MNKIEFKKMLHTLGRGMPYFGDLIPWDPKCEWPLGTRVAKQGTDETDMHKNGEPATVVGGLQHPDTGEVYFVLFDIYIDKEGTMPIVAIAKKRLYLLPKT